MSTNPAYDIVKYLRDDIQCGSNICHSPFSTCVVDDSGTKSCLHKNLFPMYPMEIVGIVVLSILMMLCTVAGIGGGGVTVPLLSVFFSFEFKEATAISGFSILICSITRYVYNFKQMHPEKKAVVIDYGLAIVMLPTVMMGSFIGVIMNAMLPDLILQVLLTLLLGFLTVQSGLKATDIFKKENVKLKAKKKALKEEKRNSKRFLGDSVVDNTVVERRSIKLSRERDNDNLYEETTDGAENFRATDTDALNNIRGAIQ